jgi:hypothetical protein
MWTTNPTPSSAVLCSIIALLLAASSSTSANAADTPQCPNDHSYPPPPVERVVGPMEDIKNIEVDKAPSGKLMTLTMLDSTGNLIPIARSYDGRDWEVAPGPYAYSGEVGITCSTDTVCEIDLEAITESGPVKETTYTEYLDLEDKKARVARFLEQTT